MRQIYLPALRHIWRPNFNVNLLILFIKKIVFSFVMTNSGEGRKTISMHWQLVILKAGTKMLTLWLHTILLKLVKLFSQLLRDLLNGWRGLQNLCQLWIMRLLPGWEKSWLQLLLQLLHMVYWKVFDHWLHKLIL